MQQLASPQQNRENYCTTYAMTTYTQCGTFWVGPAQDKKLIHTCTLACTEILCQHLLNKDPYGHLQVGFVWNVSKLNAVHKRAMLPSCTRPWNHSHSLTMHHICLVIMLLHTQPLLVLSDSENTTTRAIDGQSGRTIVQTGENFKRNHNWHRVNDPYGIISPHVPLIIPPIRYTLCGTHLNTV